MSGLDARYVLAYHFEQVFIDKTTGAPLNGEVDFFRDSSRLTPKDVYILEGAPPNYTYTNIGPTVPIANGVPTYNNNNVALYFLPYIIDGQGNITTTVDLYYYQVFNSGGGEQFTREAQPNIVETSSAQIVDINYIPNGQFLLHNNLPATDIAPIYMTGEIREAITEIAPGGWTFERPNASIATDLVTFEQQLPVLPIDQDPRYVIHLVTSTSGDNQKDLCVKFNDVNKFASTTQQYTFGFTGKTQSGTSNVNLVLIKNYGTGGSAPTALVLTTFQITSAYTNNFFSFTFGDNSAKTIGTQNDDYVQLALRHTQDSNYDVFYSDFLLTLNQVNNPVFPPTPNNDFEFRSMGGMLQSSRSPNPPYPDFDGWDLYLTIRSTKNGFIFDDSEIGDSVDESQTSLYDTTTGLHPYTNRMLAIGFQYETAGYSPLGIPFARLQAKYWISAISMPRYGTGPSFMSVTLPGATNVMLVNNNSEGAVTNAADGSSATGFTFQTIHKETTLYYTKSYLVGASTFYLENKNVGAVTAINAGTSGFTVSTVQIGDSLLPQISSITTTTIADNPGNPGKYFTFQSYNGGGVSFYVWYQVSTETDPTPGGTAIKVNLVNGDSAAIIAQKTRQALNGWQETLITTVAASTMTGGDFFTITSVTTTPGSQLYAVWYKINGVGTQPNVPGAIYIQVTLLTGSETAAQVASATQIAMNMKYFASPDFRGLYLSGWNNGSTNDPDAATRWSLVPGVIGDVIGTFQLDQNKDHNHDLSESALRTDTAGAEHFTDQVTGEQAVPQTVTISFQGGARARPLNANVNKVIKY